MIFCSSPSTTSSFVVSRHAREKLLERLFYSVTNVSPLIVFIRHTILLIGEWSIDKDAARNYCQYKHWKNPDRCQQHASIDQWFVLSRLTMRILTDQYIFFQLHCIAFCSSCFSSKPRVSFSSSSHPNLSSVQFTMCTTMKQVPSYRVKIIRPRVPIRLFRRYFVVV